MNNPLLRPFLPVVWPLQITLSLGLAGAAWLAGAPLYALALLSGAGCHFCCQLLYLHYAAAAFANDDPLLITRRLLRARAIRIACSLALFALLATKAPQLLPAALALYLILGILDACCAPRLGAHGAAHA